MFVSSKPKYYTDLVLELQIIAENKKRFDFISNMNNIIS